MISVRRSYQHHVNDTSFCLHLNSHSVRSCGKKKNLGFCCRTCFATFASSSSHVSRCPFTFFLVILGKKIVHALWDCLSEIDVASMLPHHLAAARLVRSFPSRAQFWMMIRGWKVECCALGRQFSKFFRKRRAFLTHACRERMLEREKKFKLSCHWHSEGSWPRQRRLEE